MRIERLRSALRPHLLWIGVVLALSAYAAMLWRLPPPEMWLTIDGQSEAVSFEVADPRFAAMRLAGATFVDPQGETLHCATVVVEPGANGRVEYRRTQRGVSIQIDPPAGNRRYRTRIERDDARTIEIAEAVILSLGDCPDAAIPTLPVWGRARFGDFARPADRDGAALPGALIDGSITAYARSHDSLMGVALPRTIYLVGSIDLPPGSVAYDPLPAAGKAAQLWTGRADMDGGKPGLRVRATSEARAIIFAPPNGAPERARSYAIDFSNYAQYLKDPNLVKIQFLLAAFLFLANGSRSVLRWLLGERKSLAAAIARSTPLSATDRSGIPPPSAASGKRLII